MQCKINFKKLTNLIKNIMCLGPQEQTAEARGKLGTNKEDF